MNRNEIVVLGRQVDNIDQNFRNGELKLPASSYRLAAQYLALATTELPLAKRLADKAYGLATQKSADGIAEPLEAMHAQRVLGDIHAQDLNVDAMKASYEKALQISRMYGARNRYVGVEGPRYTLAYRAISALMIAQVDDDVCSQLQTLYDQGRPHLDRLQHNPDVFRRAKRINADPCRTGFDSDRAYSRWSAWAARQS